MPSQRTSLTVLRRRGSRSHMPRCSHYAVGSPQRSYLTLTRKGKEHPGFLRTGHLGTSRFRGITPLTLRGENKKARQEGCRSWQAKEERANVSFLTVQPARIGTTMGNFPFLSRGRKTGRRQKPKHSLTITQIDGYESLVFFPCFGSQKKHLGKCPKDIHENHPN